MDGLPASLNKIIWDSNGFLTLKDLAGPGYFPKEIEQFTLDYQLDDDLKITKDRIEFGINGTVFNKDRGYKIP